MPDKIFTVDKFLGLNEAEDGTTELKLGEASKIENFTITDSYNLKSRPGVRVERSFGDRCLAMWVGYIGTRLIRLVVYQDGEKLVSSVRTIDQGDDEIDEGVMFCDQSMPVKVFSDGRNICVFGTPSSEPVDDPDAGKSYFAITLDEEGLLTSVPESKIFYRPVIFTGCVPSGSGQELEPVNILTKYVRIQFSGDGTSKVYTFPSAVKSIASVTVDGAEQEIGQHEGTPTQYTFASAPPKGENNVEFLCTIEDTDHTQAYEKFLRMRHCESYNRLFFYGDGTNICYYTEAPGFGDGLYLPIGCELAVESSASAITGMRRQNSRLLAFKPDRTFSIDYQPITLADNRVIAGFYVYPVHRGLGNEMDNQVQTVGNYARTLCGGALYEWRNASSYNPDERYAKRVSEKISRTLAAADPKKIVTCDDNSAQTYYMFLNDDLGTVLVNRYAIDVWTVYKGEAFKNVSFAEVAQGNVWFSSGGLLCCFDAESTFDSLVWNGEGDTFPINYVWESGYMSFGADYKRKYSSNIWVSMLPETASQMEIAVKTDRRDEYISKLHGLPLFDFVNMDFSNFSFVTSNAPKIKRIKIKVKKFVYYKLIFRSNKEGTRATVLGYDQQVRYSSNVK